jgi:hypothetical protein
MLQRSVERLAALVRLHGGLVRMPRNGSNLPRARSHRRLARDLVSGVPRHRPSTTASVSRRSEQGAVVRTPWSVGY